MGQGFSRHRYQRHALLVTKEGDEESGTSTDEVSIAIINIITVIATYI